MQAWPKNAVIYQIYPRSFKDSNNDGIGDLGGIIEKVDYIKGLGVDAVWLSPIYMSPQKDFGYDVSDHKNIDPIFGTTEQFKELVEKLHANDIKMVMDFIPNHTSSKHEWFKESRTSRTNPKRDWYIWADPKPDGTPPNNWLSAFGGSAWELDKMTNQYYYHAFDEDQPDLNWRNPEVKKEMFGIMKFWLDHGVDGLRVDAVDYLIEDKGLEDEPINIDYEDNFNQYTHLALIHTCTRNQPESITILKEMAAIFQEYKAKFMVTEAVTGLPQLIGMYKVVDWHSFQPFNFSLISLPWLAEPHKEFIDAYEENLDDHYLPCYVTGNHDKPRVVTRIGEKQSRNAAILLFTLRGNTFIYNGEEIGMTNGEIPIELETDTYDIHSPGLGLGRNGERTPMHWDSTKNAGFTKGNPWLPIAQNYKEINVETEQDNEKSMLSFYKELIRLKKTHPALSFGEYIPLPTPADNVFAFVRRHKNEKILVVVNFDDNEKVINLDYHGKVILNSFSERGQELLSFSNFKLRGDEGIIISCQDS